jgi:enhancer of mRNA-decapping protein 4
MQESLEGALQGQLGTALTKPMQDNFRSSFQQLLLPAFEGACQSMFSQVQHALLAGNPSL